MTADERGAAFGQRPSHFGGSQSHPSLVTDGDQPVQPVKMRLNWSHFSAHVVSRMVFMSSSKRNL